MSESDRPRVSGHCILRLPVRDLERSLAFYCDVIGYGCADRDVEIEALVAPSGGAGPGLFLMQASANEFRHIHWEQWGETYTAFEVLVDDVHALRHRLLAAGALVREPAYRGDYLTLGFFDPDGHFMFAVDARGRYFALTSRFEEMLGRSLTERERGDLQRACAATVGHDELWIIQTLLSEMRSG